MTIIEPTKNRYYTNEFLYIAVLILMLAIFNIRFYNSNVSLKYKISLQEKVVQKLEVTNADLRNQLYQILDSRNLSSIVDKQNLVSDKNPDYMTHNMLSSLN
ncbi:MAG: hypothetical protein HZB99_02960 [Candidatus Harrisonbacteria bacterium]|nr:hypothetical protein [Candidatus Harrisonbacteria bacterium]